MRSCVLVIVLASSMLLTVLKYVFVPSGQIDANTLTTHLSVLISNDATKEVFASFASASKNF